MNEKKRMLKIFTQPKTPFASTDLCVIGKLYSQQRCNSLLHELTEEINWNDDHCVVVGRRFDIPRLQAWYADEGIEYNYSNNLLKTQTWLESLSAIKHDVQQISSLVFNSVLVTFYRDGNDYVNWHADDEDELGADPIIASLSLGATRAFQYRRLCDGLSGEVMLNNGDLLIMQPGFQKGWEHRVPKQPAINEPRLNLTFRNVIPPR